MEKMRKSRKRKENENSHGCVAVCDGYWYRLPATAGGASTLRNFVRKAATQTANIYMRFVFVDANETNYFHFYCATLSLLFHFIYFFGLAGQVDNNFCTINGSGQPLPG